MLSCSWRTRAIRATRNRPNWNKSCHVTMYSHPLSQWIGGKRSGLPPKRGNRLPGCWQHHNYSNGFPSEKQAKFDMKCPGAVRHRGVSYSIQGCHQNQGCGQDNGVGVPEFAVHRGSQPQSYHQHQHRNPDKPLPVLFQGVYQTAGGENPNL